MPNDDPSSSFIGLSELVQLLPISRKTILRKVRAPVNPLPASLVGGKLVFDWPQVVKWIRSQQIQQVDLGDFLDALNGED